MNYGLTQMTLDDLYLWLENHQDARIVTDVKERNIDALKMIVESGYQNYFVVQVYNKEEIIEAKELGFENIILTLYRVSYDDRMVINIANDYDLWAVTMNVERAGNGDLPKALAKNGVPVYLHTINKLDQITSPGIEGIYGFYTDFVFPKMLSGGKF